MFSPAGYLLFRCTGSDGCDRQRCAPSGSASPECLHHEGPVWCCPSLLEIVMWKTKPETSTILPEVPQVEWQRRRTTQPKARRTRLCRRRSTLNVAFLLYFLEQSKRKNDFTIFSQPPKGVGGIGGCPNRRGQVRCRTEKSLCHQDRLVLQTKRHQHPTQHKHVRPEVRALPEDRLPAGVGAGQREPLAQDLLQVRDLQGPAERQDLLLPRGRRLLREVRQRSLRTSPYRPLRSFFAPPPQPSHFLRSLVC